MNSAVWVAVIAAGSAFGGSWLAFAGSRRVARGRIGTSEAATLWEQARLMRAELVAARDKAEQQRDRLIESQAATVVPALAHISDALDSIVGTLTSNAAKLDRIAEQVCPSPAPAGGGGPAGDR